MKKRPLCAICVLFLVIQSIRVLFFGVEEMQPSALEKAVSCGEKQVELAGTVYRIEQKKKVTAVFLKVSYWNNRRICSANGGLPPMIKRRQYYEALELVA